ncbi:NAD-dependent epimerase/dehydratase family protein [Aggregatimonas sangjinii]|uniref:NAD-dependent epimerase/dehydratase family protein n=1 Tax=Aggregatimonas sangjinii TaxID=2583587 RepID=A0A5B7SZF5_9FLAO|nr:SDR family oxidoreductase [Aggregatimonas sangjinii]QCX02194.1 NAD-dependent epimerase/dehydratase family protein [Aggregatimonas sangjinii]
MHIILTGATGTLGSQILFQLLANPPSEVFKILLLVRKRNERTPKERIRAILESSFLPKELASGPESLFEKIEVIDSELLWQPSTFLEKEKKYHFIHSAGYVNLSNSENRKEEIFNENYLFTKRIFNTYQNYLAKFVYIGTAFSIGNKGGLIGNDYHTFDNITHRNHYEASKHAAERFLIAQGQEMNIPVQILRPSVLGGNYNGTPRFFISKYMVFYLFAKFFYRNSSNHPVRITALPGRGLNIIPTDYAAAVIVKVLNTDIKQLNIVHSKGTDTYSGMAKILKTVGFKTFSITPNNIDHRTGYKNKLEMIYHRTIGAALTPYLISEQNEWDTQLLESILPIPDYSLETYLTNTIKYAKAGNFEDQQW